MPNYQIFGPERKDLVYRVKISPRETPTYLSRWTRYNLSDEEKKLPIPSEVHVLQAAKGSGGGEPHVLGTGGGPFIVSPELRKLIESLEPDTHDWHPLKVVTEFSLPFDVYYLLRVPVEIDSGYDPTGEMIPNFFWEAPAEGHVIWRAKRHGYHCSEQFKKALEQSHFKNHLLFNPLREPPAEKLSSD